MQANQYMVDNLFRVRLNTKLHGMEGILLRLINQCVQEKNIINQDQLFSLLFDREMQFWNEIDPGFYPLLEQWFYWIKTVFTLHVESSSLPQTAISTSLKKEIWSLFVERLSSDSWLVLNQCTVCNHNQSHGGTIRILFLETCVLCMYNNIPVNLCDVQTMEILLKSCGSNDNIVPINGKEYERYNIPLEMNPHETDEHKSLLSDFNELSLHTDSKQANSKKKIKKEKKNDSKMNKKSLLANTNIQESVQCGGDESLQNSLKSQESSGNNNNNNYNISSSSSSSSSSLESQQDLTDSSIITYSTEEYSSSTSSKKKSKPFHDVQASTEKSREDNNSVVTKSNPKSSNKPTHKSGPKSFIFVVNKTPS